MAIRNILAVRTDRFGECLLNIPALRALKQTFKGSNLTLVANPYVAELAKCLDTVDEVIGWQDSKRGLSEALKFSRQLKQKKFDLCVIFNPSKYFNIISFLAGIPVRLGYDRKWGFLLTHKIKDEKYLGKKHEIDYNLDLVSRIGAATNDKDLSLKINSDIINNLCKEFDIDISRRPVALHPWTSDPLKQWPVENFRRLAQRIQKELDSQVLIVGGKEEQDKGNAYFSGLPKGIINLIGKTTLVQLGALLSKCRLLISGDSGPAHLASCVGTPVLAIFRNDIPGKGPLRWGPRGKGSVIIEKSSLTDISVEEVFDKIKEVLR